MAQHYTAPCNTYDSRACPAATCSDARSVASSAESPAAAVAFRGSSSGSSSRLSFGASESPELKVRISVIDPDITGPGTKAASSDPIRQLIEF